jgi:putative ATP-dependent endonuclease of OLD family
LSFKESHVKSTSASVTGASEVRVIVVVEGVHDIEFLTRLAVTLHREDPAIPDLAEMARRGELIFVPFGGGDVSLWTERLAPLAIPEFHLYDRELPPETELRQRAADQVNTRPGCRALLTRKRSLENYLHPHALLLAGGPEIEIGDEDSVPELVARTWFEGSGPNLSWDELPRRSQKRLANRAKRWLNTRAVEQMTLAMLSERDPSAEVVSWFASIVELAGLRA